MKWFQNLRIRSRLLVSFGVCIFFSAILAIMGIMSVTTVNSNYTYLLSEPQERLESLLAIQTQLMTMRYRTANFVMESNNPDIINNTLVPQFEAAYASLNKNLDEYVRNNNADVRRDPQIIKTNLENIQKFKTLLEQYTQVIYKTRDLARANDPETATTTLRAAIPQINEINALLDSMIAPTIEYKDGVTSDTENSVRNTIILLIVLAVILCIVACILAFFIGNSMSNSIAGLGIAAKEIARGNLDVDLASNAKDEVGDLTRNLRVMMDVLNNLIKKIDEQSDRLENGDLDARIDASLFQGTYKSVVEGVNGMVGGLIDETLNFLNCMTEFGNGNFSADIPKLPGGKVIVNNTLDSVRNNLKSVNHDIYELVGAASLGKLTNRVNTDYYKGDWYSLMDKLNKLMEAVSAPIQEASEVMQQVSAGNFDKKMNGNYHGDFMTIKNSINNTVTNIASYIDEISEVVSGLSHKNLDQAITREYVGKFSNIKDAINNITNTLNTVITDISSAASQVSAGAKQISESSMTLAQGASEQSSSIEELNATTITIDEGAKQNARNTKEAESLSDSSKSNAVKGSQDMNHMLASMEGIKDSSNKISKIIKVIDDIAFQTNLLALNAAVEAARAGEHGKGFAVVAEEVRSLAGRSQNAAKETAELIEESINRVNEGTEIAGLTANALQAIVVDVTKVADIITRIAGASEKQMLSIGQVTEGLSQITEVVQSNSATSEEAASASQQLSSQSEVMKNLVSVFNLKRILR